MATHGYSGTVRWLLGSVAEKVLRALTSDLLSVQPQGANGNNVIELEAVLPTVMKLASPNI